MRKANPTPWRLLASLQTCLLAVLALCLGNAWGSRTVDPLDLPKAERPILSESAEDAGYYFNARFYDAERGSFIGRDPKLQFWTPYSYVGNGPLVGVDPTGMEVPSYSLNGPDFKSVFSWVFTTEYGITPNQFAAGVENASVPQGTLYGGLDLSLAGSYGYGQYEAGAFYDFSAAENMIVPYQTFSGALGIATSGPGATIGYYKGGSQENFAGLSIPVNLGPLSVYLSKQGDVVGASLSTSLSFGMGVAQTYTMLPTQRPQNLPTAYRCDPSPADATYVRPR